MLRCWALWLALRLTGVVAGHLLHAFLVLRHAQDVVHHLLHQALAAKLTRKVVRHCLIGHLIDVGVAVRV